MADDFDWLRAHNERHERRKAALALLDRARARAGDPNAPGYEDRVARELMSLALAEGLKTAGGER